MLLPYGYGMVIIAGCCWIADALLPGRFLPIVDGHGMDSAGPVVGLGFGVNFLMRYTTDTAPSFWFRSASCCLMRSPHFPSETAGRRSSIGAIAILLALDPLRRSTPASS